MKPLSEKIEELEKGCGRIHQSTSWDGLKERNECSKKGVLCSKCMTKLQAFKEAQKLQDKKVKELKNLMGDNQISSWYAKECIDKIFGEDLSE